MYEPPLEDSKLFEREAWKELIKSDEWKYFKKLIEDHKKYLEWQILNAVSNKKFDDASEFSAKLSECSKILQLVDLRLMEIKKEDR